MLTVLGPRLTVIDRTGVAEATAKDQREAIREELRRADLREIVVFFLAIGATAALGILAAWGLR